jgi:predicted nucleic acid-binding protein
MTKVYLDACSLNRPFDDQTQDRIRLEAEAVRVILARLQAGEWHWIGSEVLDVEIERTPNAERRAKVKLLAQRAHGSVRVGPQQEARGAELERLGFREFDALHLACAEAGGADVFLTTDDPCSGGHHATRPAYAFGS